MAETMTAKMKEALNVQELCENLASRTRMFNEALRRGDPECMLCVFLLEQAEHFRLMSDTVSNMDLKLMLIEHSMDTYERVTGLLNSNFGQAVMERYDSRFFQAP